VGKDVRAIDIDQAVQFGVTVGLEEIIESPRRQVEPRKRAKDAHKAEEPGKIQQRGGGVEEEEGWPFGFTRHHPLPQSSYKPHKADELRDVPVNGAGKLKCCADGGNGHEEEIEAM
jgi:hypothetical protein